MNLRFKPISFFLSVTALTLVARAVSAQTEPTTAPIAIEAATTPTTASTETATTPESQSNAFFFLAPTKETTPQATQTTTPVVSDSTQTSQVPPSPEPISDLTSTAKAPSPQPIPGSTLTSAATLSNQPESSSSDLQALSDSSDQIAQTNLDPGRSTRSGSSYVGIGGNIGFTGDTSLGNGSFAILSKIGLTNNVSIRPAVLLGSDATFLIPVTYDFNIRTRDIYEPVRFAPYVGGGLIISTDDGNNIGFLLSGGVDVPISRQFTATAGLNLGFLEDTVDPGLLLGIGYNIPNF